MLYIGASGLRSACFILVLFLLMVLLWLLVQCGLVLRVKYTHEVQAPRPCSDACWELHACVMLRVGYNGENLFKMGA